MTDEDIEDLTDRCDTLQGTIAALEDSVAELEDRVSNLEAENNKLRGTINDLEQGMSLVKDCAFDLQTVLKNY